MQTNEDAQKNKNWDEQRLAQSRLQNLAKAREVAKAKKQPQKEPFSVTPVEAGPEKPEIPQPTPSDAAPKPETVSLIYRATEKMGALSLTVLSLALPLAINALIDYYYPRVRDYVVEARQPPKDNENDNTSDQWKGQSIFRQ